MDSSGGGGFGDPLERALDAVAADLAEGYVTAAAAEAIYGVVLRGGAIDPEASARRREAAARGAPARSPPRGGRPRNRARALHPARRGHRGSSGCRRGAVVELVNQAGAPLRAWVTDVLPGNGHTAQVPPVALRMLALPDGAEVDIRAIHSGTLGA